MTDARSDLVPGRECGSCTACCTHLLVNSKDFVKLQSVTCEHCKGGHGCNIYETRPAVCRSFYCGWRMMPELDGSWRPDRNGIIISASFGRSGGAEYYFTVFGSKNVLFNPRVAMVVARFVRADRQTFLVLPRPPDEAPSGVYLNDGLRAAVQRNDIPAVTSGLTLAYEAGLRAPVRKVTAEELAALATE